MKIPTLLSRLGAAAAFASGLAAAQAVTVLPPTPQYMEPVYVRISPASGRNELIYGDTAVVTGLDTIAGMNKGQPYTAKGLYTDVWIKRDGRWQCVRTHASPSNK